MYVVVFNRETMNKARQQYENYPSLHDHWHSSAELAHVIDEAIAEAKDYGDEFPPKIFIVKD
jgi:hypothetical protein